MTGNIIFKESVMARYLVKLQWMVAVALALIAVACSGDEDPSTRFQFTDAVTVVSVDKSAGTTFEFYRPGSMTPVLLPTRYLLDSNLVGEGTRLLLTMSTDGIDPLASGADVKLLAYQKMQIDYPSQAIDADPLAGSDPLGLQSAWLTGPWLNIRAMMPMSIGNYTFKVMTSNANAADGSREIYLVMEMATSDPYYTVERYYSVDLTSVLVDDPSSIVVRAYCPANPTVETIRLDVPRL